MINYIKAELYRNFNRMYFWVYTAVMVILAVSMNFLLYTASVTELNLDMIFKIIINMLPLPLFLIALYVDMVSAEEQKNLTLRNTIAYGINRSKIVLSKIITATILASISAVIVLTLFTVTGLLLLNPAPDFYTNIGGYLLRIAAALPLWIGAISLATLLSLLFNNNNVYAGVYVALLFVPQGIIKLLATFVSEKFANLNNALLSYQLGAIASADLNIKSLACPILVGLAYILIFAILTMVYFNRKEIK